MRPLLACLILAAAACSSPPTAKPPPPGDDPKVEDCDNGRDDDGDGDVDCFDDDCEDDCTSCGDGVVQEPEACDGTDLAGETCASRGFAPEGVLSCKKTCEFDTSNCFYPPEDCATAGDEDQNGAADCQDRECVDWPTCLSLKLVRAPAEGLVTEALPDPIVLEVSGGDGKPRARVTVTLQAPPGAVGSTSSARTDATGRVSLPVRLGRQAGTATFVATIEAAPPVSIPIRALDPEPGAIHTVVGIERKDGEDVSGPAITAQIHAPIDIAVAADHTLYVAESCRILRISPEGDLSVLAGTNTCGDPGPTLEPGEAVTVSGIALSEAGDRLFFTAVSAGLGRVWDLDLATRKGTVIAGGGELDPAAAEGLPATEARLTTLGRVRTGPGSSLLVTDEDRGSFLRVELATGILTTWLAAVDPMQEEGCAAAIALREPDEVIFDAQGNGFVSGSICGSDCFNAWNGSSVPGNVRGILRVDAATTSLAHVGGRLAGAAPGELPASLVAFPGSPSGAFDAAGNLLAVAGNQLFRIDGVHLGAELIGPAGASDPGFSGELVSAYFARYSGPRALAVASNGDVYVADSGNYAVRRIVHLGRSEPSTVEVIQEDPVPTAYLGQTVPVAPGAFAARVVVRDGAGVELPFRRLHVSTTPAPAVAPTADADRRGVAELTVHAPLEGTRLDLDIRVPDLHGGSAGPFAARVDLVEPEVGMTLTAVRGGEETPEGALYGPTASLPVSDFALASDGTAYVSAACRVYAMDRLGVIEPLAGTGECGYEGDGGPALSATLSIAGLELDDAGQRLIVIQGGGHALRVIDLATATIDELRPDHLPLAIPGDVAYAFGRNELGTLDLDTGDYAKLFDYGPDTCDARPEGSIAGLLGLLALDGGDIYLGAWMCRPSGADRGVIRRRVATTTTVLRLLEGGPTADGVSAIGAGGQGLLGITVDASGRLVYADPLRIRRVEDDGTVTTLAGRLEGGIARDYVSATAAAVHSATSLQYDEGGHLWFVSGGELRLIW